MRKRKSKPTRAEEIAENFSRKTIATKGDLKGLLAPTIDLESFLSNSSFRAPEFIAHSAWLEHAPFALWLMEALRPSVFVELGVHNGFSYFALCQGARMAGVNAAGYAVDNWELDEHAGLYSGEVYDEVARQNAGRYADYPANYCSTI